MAIETIASKFRRALRSGKGATFSRDQMQELAAIGVLGLITDAEVRDLCQSAHLPNKPNRTDVTSVGSVDLPELTNSTIAELTRNI